MAADLTSCIRHARSVADQPADFGRQPLRIYCLDRVACRQLGQLTRRAVKKGLGATKRASGHSPQMLVGIGVLDEDSYSLGGVSGFTRAVVAEEADASGQDTRRL
jgi:hypothetical protein